ncbi:MAG TPA: hypothetical protein VKF32_16415 [Thermoanaerobaculia bacterium]|nr:hypothetical protein [Thermoanaerobaculia bacterium]
MPGKRFIVTYKGKGAAPAIAERLQGLPDVSVLDASLGHMLLVEGPEDKLRPAVESMGDWSLTPETAVPLPDVRKTVKGAPGH